MMYKCVKVQRRSRGFEVSAVLLTHTSLIKHTISVSSGINNI